MSQDLTDLRKRRAGGHHRGGGRVTRAVACLSPVRAAARVTTPLTPVTDNGWCGARTRTNTARVSMPGGRPRRRYPATASPASAGNGIRSIRLPLPRMTSSPAHPSISSRLSDRTSPGRSPRRTISVTIAKSRRPMRVRRSHAANSRVIAPASNPRGRPARAPPATDGTAAAGDDPTMPSTCRKPSRDRSAVTISLADPTGRPAQPTRTNPITSAAVSDPRSRPPSSARRPSRKGRSSTAYVTAVCGDNPRSRTR